MRQIFFKQPLLDNYVRQGITVNFSSWLFYILRACPCQHRMSTQSPEDAGPHTEYTSTGQIYPSVYMFRSIFTVMQPKFSKSESKVHRVANLACSLKNNKWLTMHTPSLLTKKEDASFYREEAFHKRAEGWGGGEVLFFFASPFLYCLVNRLTCCQRSLCECALAVGQSDPQACLSPGGKWRPWYAISGRNVQTAWLLRQAWLAVGLPKLCRRNYLFGPWPKWLVLQGPVVIYLFIHLYLIHTDSSKSMSTSTGSDNILLSAIQKK